MTEPRPAALSLVTDDNPPTTERGHIEPVEFDDLYRDEFAPLCRVAFAMCGSQSLAEEIVHDVFLTAYRKWDRIQLLDRPGAWLRRCVINRSVSQLRRSGYEARALLRLGNRPPARADDDAYLDADHELWQAARKLPKKQAQAIVLRYVDDLEANQIAEIMECQPSTVRVHLTRARAALATTLGGSSEEATAVDGSTIAPFISESEATA